MKRKHLALMPVPRKRQYIRVISVWSIHLHSLIDKKSPPSQTCCSSDRKGVRRITCNQRLMGLWNNMKYWMMSLSLTFGVIQAGIRYRYIQRSRLHKNQHNHYPGVFSKCTKESIYKRKYLLVLIYIYVSI